MTKQAYLERLKGALADLPLHEKEEIINDYHEHFRMGVENGKNEEEIAFNLGYPESIAAQFVNDYKAKHKDPQVPQKSSGTKAAIIIGLIFFNVVFVFGPFMGIVGTLIGFFAASVGISVAGGATVIVSALSPIINLGSYLPFSPIVAVLVGIGLTCLGILFFIGNVYLTKFFYKGCEAYLGLMKKIVND